MMHEADIDVVCGQSMRIHYHAIGEGPTVLLLHGWAMSWHLWKGAMLALARAGYRAVAPDLIGCGQSSKPWLFYTPGDYGRCIEAFLDALRPGKVVVAGHSLGGYLALWLALRRPQQVAKLALVGPAFSLLRQIALTRAELLLTLAGLPLLGELSLAVAPRAALRWMLSRPWGGFYRPERLPDGMIDQVVADLLDNATPLVCNTIRLLLLGSLPGVGRTGLSTDLLPRAPAVAAPTLLVWGERDALLRPDAYRLLAARLPHVTLRPVAEAGHSPQIEAPEEFMRSLLAFLQ